MAVLLRALRALLPVLRLQPWVLSGMIILGMLAALSEGLSISLFIPLIQHQMQTQTTGLTGRLTALFEAVPSGHRFLWIGFSILLLLSAADLAKHSIRFAPGEATQCSGVRSKREPHATNDRDA
jgi:hypothetical protein